MDRCAGGGGALNAVAVVGGGLAGLAAATRLAAAHDVVVFEQAPQAGGKIRSQPLGEYLFEWGPNGFLSSAAELRALVSDAGLDGELTEAPRDAARRFVYWDGRLHEVALAPQRALRTSLLSVRGKARAVGELFVRRAPGGAEESVDAFFRRRFGREVAERLVAPALLGITGGDAAASGVAALFPRLGELERDHGSVIRGMLRARRPPGRLTGFGSAGMQRLTDRLAQRLGARLRTGCPVERIERHGTGWRVHHAAGTTDADAVVVATPADATAALVEPFDPELARLLREIAYAPMRVAGVAFRRADVAAPLDGFGFLVARGNGLRILGALYTSTIFPQHAPGDVVYLRVFLGGAADPEAATLPPDRVLALVREELAIVLGIVAEPVAFHDVTWDRAIPQYGPAHVALLGRIDARLAEHPRLALAGNAYRGVGVGDTVRDAFAAALRVA